MGEQRWKKFGELMDGLAGGGIPDCRSVGDGPDFPQNISVTDQGHGSRC